MKEGGQRFCAALASHCKTAQQETSETSREGPLLSFAAKANTDASVWGEGGAGAVNERHAAKIILGGTIACALRFTGTGRP